MPDGEPDTTSDAPAGGPSRPSSDRWAARKGEADAWGAFGLVASGVLVWGGVGAYVGSVLDNRLPLVAGLLVGMFAGLYLVWFRYGRS